MKTRGDFTADKRIVLLSAVAAVIGVLCSFIAVLLLKMISFFTNVFYYFKFSTIPHAPAQSPFGTWMIFIPVLGGLIIGLMAKYGSEKIRGHGIPEALEAILVGRSIMSPKVAVLKPLSSAISIGSGGPFGAEGPIIMTGGAVGSLIAQGLHLSAVERKTLLVAGAAAGMSATFASPIAAVLLAVELLLFEWKPRSLVPVAIASIIASAIRTHLLGAGPLFTVAPHETAGWQGLLISLGIGLIAGAFSTGTSNLLYKMEDAFEHLPVHWMWRPALGGLVVGIGGYFQPRALGVGYDVIADLLHGHMAVSVILALVAVKCVIWIVSLASGTSGGVLAPLLIMGCGLGALEGTFIGDPLHNLWPLVSMAAVLGGMMRAPFTAVLFALELTNDVNALLPLLIASISAYAFTVLAMKRSILTEKVARKGHDVFREYGIDPLEKVRVKTVMTKEVISIPSSEIVSEIYNKYFLFKNKHRGYPVVNEHGDLIGVLTISDLLKQSLDGSGKDFKAEDLICRDPVTITSEASCRDAAEKLATYEIGRLPVVKEDNPKRMVGIITRSDLLKPRRTHVEDEEKYERVLGEKV